ncbi:helix-turn-helix domain-containing protein [Nocardia asiatica]|uniref:helix-turn-helix domain-containing protein n=1 Tax=Nocardia asiatica TaxID=209252 RepID=UPI0024540756|nr:helix-turn-helix domain-containing protein [Nocardia asiatica]
MGETAQDPRARGVGRPRDESVEQRVLATVREMLLDVGWDELSVRAVAARAGVGRASISRRWGSKAELVLHAVLGETPDLGPFEGADQAGWLDWVLRGSRELFARGEVRAAVPGLLTALDRDPQLRNRLWSGFSTPAAALFAAGEPEARAESESDARAVIALAAGAALFLEFVAEGAETARIHRRIGELLHRAVLER